MVAAVHKAGWRHQPCFAHTLNLIVKDSLKSVPEVVKLLKFLFSPQHTGHREAQGYSATIESGRAQANPVSSYSVEFSFLYAAEAL